MRRPVFISVANKEFAQLRADARDVLSGNFDVIVQPDFTASASDTIRKLDEKIAPCELLIHIVGQFPGSTANPDAIGDFFAHVPQENFLAEFPRPKGLLGDCSSLTYFQWEPWLALHRGIPVIVLAVEGHDLANFPQRDHLDNLRVARCDLDTLRSEAQRVGQITGIVFNHFGIVPLEAKKKLAAPRFLHHAAEHFMGRDEELAMLDSAWMQKYPENDGEDRTINLLSLIAWGGVGKTSLLSEWIKTRLVGREWKHPETGEPDLLRYFDWSFYDQGTASDELAKARELIMKHHYGRRFEELANAEAASENW